MEDRTMNGFDMTAADKAAHIRPSERMIKMSDRSVTDIERMIEDAHVLRSAYTAQLLRDFARRTARQARSVVRRLRSLMPNRPSDRPQATVGEA
jgi:hypothetical protein